MADQSLANHALTPAAQEMQHASDEESGSFRPPTPPPSFSEANTNKRYSDSAIARHASKHQDKRASAPAGILADQGLVTNSLVTPIAQAILDDLAVDGSTGGNVEDFFSMYSCVPTDNKRASMPSRRSLWSKLPVFLQKSSELLPESDDKSGSSLFHPAFNQLACSCSQTLKNGGSPINVYDPSLDPLRRRTSLSSSFCSSDADSRELLYEFSSTLLSPSASLLSGDGGERIASEGGRQSKNQYETEKSGALFVSGEVSESSRYSDLSSLSPCTSEGPNGMDFIDRSDNPLFVHDFTANPLYNYDHSLSITGDPCLSADIGGSPVGAALSQREHDFAASLIESANFAALRVSDSDLSRTPVASIPCTPHPTPHPTPQKKRACGIVDRAVCSIEKNYSVSRTLELQLETQPDMSMARKRVPLGSLPVNNAKETSSRLYTCPDASKLSRNSSRTQQGYEPGASETIECYIDLPATTADSVQSSPPETDSRNSNKSKNAAYGPSAYNQGKARSHLSPTLSAIPALIDEIQKEKKRLKASGGKDNKIVTENMNSYVKKCNNGLAYIYQYCSTDRSKDLMQIASYFYELLQWEKMLSDKTQIAVSLEPPDGFKNQKLDKQKELIESLYPACVQQLNDKIKAIEGNVNFQGVDQLKKLELEAYLYFMKQYVDVCRKYLNSQS